MRRVSLDGLQRINIIFGQNGSGKTSLLEAIHLLGLGRSFRSSRIAPLIHHDMDQALVFGEIEGAGGLGQSLGLTKTRSGDQQLRLDKRPVAGRAELARVLPLQLLDAESFSLVDGGPKPRRQFMDWGVFHVKHPFMEHWSRAQRALKQRNSLLRGAARGAGDGRMRGEARPDLVTGGLAAWDAELIQSALVVDELRRAYLDLLLPHLHRVLGRFPELPPIQLHYRRGWRHDCALEDALKASLPRDRELGFSQVGPHRATLDISIDGRPAVEVLSRGQQKLAVAALRLAQGACMAEQTGTRGVYLVDDLPAELDSRHRQTLCRLLDELGSQVFITSVDADVMEGAALRGVWSNQDEVRRFHVEQGVYRCLKS